MSAYAKTHSKRALRAFRSVCRTAGLFLTHLVGGMALLDGHALAWGTDGHRLIATVAEMQLTPHARSEVLRLLEQEPGATLATVSMWADERRSPSTAAWHYVNFRPDEPCVFVPERHCANGACVVSAIERQQGVLASAASDSTRLLALKYLVHFVGDVHQPLHAGYAIDHGGNKVQLQAFGRGTNLHSVWDGDLLRKWPGGLTALQAEIESDTSASLGQPARWAQESCEILKVPGFYPNGRFVGDAYQEKWAPTLKRQLSLAARRLAATLNVSLQKK